MFCLYTKTVILGFILAVGCQVTSGSACVDREPACDSYDRHDLCAGDFAAWAHEFCPKYCGFCTDGAGAATSTVGQTLPAFMTTPQPAPDSCEDLDVACSDYSYDEICIGDHSTWARVFCPLYCNFCTTTTSTTTEPTSTTTSLTQSTRHSTSRTSTVPTSTVTAFTLTQSTAATTAHTTNPTTVPTTSPTTTPKTVPSTAHTTVPTTVTTPSPTTPGHDCIRVAVCEDKVHPCGHYDCADTNNHLWLWENCQSTCNMCNDCRPCVDQMQNCDVIASLICGDETMVQSCEKTCNRCPKQ